MKLTLTPTQFRVVLSAIYLAAEWESTVMDSNWPNKDWAARKRYLTLRTKLSKEPSR